MILSITSPCERCGNIVTVYAVPIDANDAEILALVHDARVRKVSCHACALTASELAACDMGNPNNNPEMRG